MSGCVGRVSGLSPPIGVGGGGVAHWVGLPRRGPAESGSAQASQEWKSTSMKNVPQPWAEGGGAVPG